MHKGADTGPRFDKPLRKMASDKTGSTGDEYFFPFHEFRDYLFNLFRSPITGALQFLPMTHIDPFIIHPPSPELQVVKK